MLKRAYGRGSNLSTPCQTQAIQVAVHKLQATSGPGLGKLLQDRVKGGTETSRNQEAPIW